VHESHFKVLSLQTSTWKVGGVLPRTWRFKSRDAFTHVSWRLTELYFSVAADFTHIAEVFINSWIRSSEVIIQSFPW